MRILFLGGTSFVGRHIAEAVIAAGHRVTFFNRGVTDGALFPECERLRGDRTVDVARLGAVAADVVIDSCGFTPDDVRASAAAVAPWVKRYVFISSVDALDLSAAAIDESSPTRALPPGTQTATQEPDLYGVHKAQCERELVAVLGAERALVVRPGLVVGPFDATDRFTYWVARVARGGEVLAPRGPSLPVQVIDARDLATWIAGALAHGLSGAYDLVGDPHTLALADVLETARALSGSDARFTYVSDAFLEAQEVGAWVELPLWLPALPELRGLLNVANDKARRAGLTLRPLDRTIADVLAEYGARPHERTLRAGLSPERETALLRAWSAATMRP
ncbi:MAG: SDR family oxidoreductase [Vulcanimicrobiaceae bacterium]